MGRQGDRRNETNSRFRKHMRKYLKKALQVAKRSNWCYFVCRNPKNWRKTFL